MAGPFDGTLTPMTQGAVESLLVVRRDGRGNGVDNRLECKARDTNLVDKWVDAAASRPLSLAVPEGATNI